MEKINKIIIIGAGNVGSTIAYTLAVKMNSFEIVMIDSNQEKAQGECLDILQSVSSKENCFIRSGSYEDAKNADIVLITAGTKRKIGQTRNDLLQENLEILQLIMKKINSVALNAIFIMVSNPVDIMTYYMLRYSKLPSNKMIGLGTALDEARLKIILSDRYKVSKKYIEVLVLGEHGEGIVIAWSNVKINKQNIEDYLKTVLYYSVEMINSEYNEIELQLRNAGMEIIQRKGATYYAISALVFELCDNLLNDKRNIVNISTILESNFDIDGVCLSMPCHIGSNGIISKANFNITKEENMKLTDIGRRQKEKLVF